MMEERRTELQKVTGADADLVAFWQAQQELAAQYGVEIEEAE